MAREGTKTAAAIAVMVANKDKSMEEVLPLIATATNHDLAHARNYYVWCVRKGVAPGVIPVTTRGRKATATVTVAKPTKEKPVKLSAKTTEIDRKITKPSKAERQAAMKPIADDIKAKNLARMKQLATKAKKPVNDPEVANFNFDDEDSFSAPAFLTRDEVNALI